MNDYRKTQRRGRLSSGSLRNSAPSPQGKPTQTTDPTNKAIHIRRARPADSVDIASVLGASFAEYEPLYTAAAFAVTTSTPHGVLERMKDGPMWVAVQNGRIVGTVSVLHTDSALYIRGMAVLPAVRGRGVGRLLLQRIEAFAAGQHVSSLLLSTTPFLTNAISLYEHCGFRRTGEGPFDLLGTPLFSMEKRK